jgi:hypothetical protein
MADEARVVLFNVKINVDESEKSLKALTKTMGDAAKAKKGLSKETEEAEKKAKKQEQTIKSLDEVLKTETKTIAQLRESNKQLNIIRNNADITSKDGIETLNRANKALDANNAKIKANVDAYTKQKIGIGDYTGSLGQFFPMLGKVTQGAKGFNAGLTAISANPVGLILTALALIIQGVTSNLKKFEPVMDAVENVTRGFNDVVNVLITNMKALGEIALNVLTLNFGKAAEGAGKLAGEIEMTYKQGQKLLEATRELEDETFRYEIATAKLTNELKALQMQAKNVNLTYEEKNAILKQVSDLENKYTDEAVALATKRFNIERDNLLQDKFNAEQREEYIQGANESQEAYLDRLIASGDFAGEELQKLIDLYKSIQTEASAGFALQEKLANQAEANAQKAEADRLKAIEQEEKRRKAIEDRIAKQEEASLKAMEADIAEFNRKQALIKAEQDYLTALTQRWTAEDARRQQEITNTANELSQWLALNEEQSEAETLNAEKTYQAELAIIKKRSKARIDWEKKTEFEKLNVLQAGMAMASSLFKQGSAEAKALAVGNAIINTYKAANVALASAPPPFGQILMGLTIASGLKNVKEILKTDEKKVSGFAEGGKVLSGQFIGRNDGTPIRRSNGDNLLATVKTGEVILNETQQAMLGGDSTFRRLGIRGFAEGGYTDMSSARNEASTTGNFMRIADSIATQKTVLIMEEWEYKYGNIVEVRESAQVV